MADRAVVDQLHQRDRAGCQGPKVVDFVWLGTEVERVALAVPGHRGQPQHECSGATISAGASLNKEEKKALLLSARKNRITNYRRRQETNQIAARTGWQIYTPLFLAPPPSPGPGGKPDTGRMHGCQTKQLSNQTYVRFGRVGVGIQLRNVELRLIVRNVQRRVPHVAE